MTKPTPDNDNTPKKRYIITFDFESKVAVLFQKEDALIAINGLLKHYSPDDINIYEVGEPMHPVIGF